VPTSEQEISIVNKYGLHARPAMQLVELSNGFGSKIELSTNSITVDGKSIMSVMRLGAAKGTILKVVADGDDADEAVIAIAKLVSDGFGEMEGA
jgi:phosphocarrier protein HPr